MGFQSINEIENFSFEDCVIGRFEILEDQIRMVLEALIVKPHNSQNKNFTESYAGTMTVRLQGGKVVSAAKEGYKCYNADEVLISEVPDEPLTIDETKELAKTFGDAMLFAMDKIQEENGVFTYSLRVEFPNKEEYDDSVTDTYELIVEFAQAIFEWEYYMNRVQR